MRKAIVRACISRVTGVEVSPGLEVLLGEAFNAVALPSLAGERRLSRRSGLVIVAKEFPLDGLQYLNIGPSGL